MDVLVVSKNIGRTMAGMTRAGVKGLRMCRPVGTIEGVTYRIAGYHVWRELARGKRWDRIDFDAFLPSHDDEEYAQSRLRIIG